ncbi:MAG: methyltransferase domain-containing protein [Actinomycetota bacterium]
MSRVLWQPAPAKIIEEMLKIAGVKPGELVIDLGSGDSRIPIIAARKFQARAIGIEINPLLFFYSRIRVRLAGLDDRVKIVRGNFYKADVSEADVVTFFLNQTANERLSPKLKRELKSGARIISYYWTLPDWPLIKSDPLLEIYLYEKK